MFHEDSFRWLGARISVRFSEKRPHLDRCGPPLHFAACPVDNKSNHMLLWIETLNFRSNQYAALWKEFDPGERENYIVIDENCLVPSITRSA
jgi:hypothetical protein